MTVSSTTIKVSYTGSTGTVFPYTFMIYEDSDIEVIKRSSAGVETTLSLAGGDYTVSGVGEASGGNVTLTTALDSGETLVLRSNIPALQSLDYQTGDDFPAESHEKGLDKLTRIAQQILEELDRCFKVAPSYTSSISAVLPEPSDGKALGWSGSTLTNIASPGALSVSAFAETLLDDTTADAARATLEAAGVDDPFWLTTWTNDPEFPGSAVSGKPAAACSTSARTWFVNQQFGVPSGKSFQYTLEVATDDDSAGQTLSLALDYATQAVLPIETMATLTTYSTTEILRMLDSSGNYVHDGRYYEVTGGGTTNSTLPTPPAVGSTVGFGSATLTARDGDFQQFASGSLAMPSTPGVFASHTFTSPLTGVSADVMCLRLRNDTSVGGEFYGLKATPS
jgi:hypothetical protein